MTVVGRDRLAWRDGSYRKAGAYSYNGLRPLKRLSGINIRALIAH